MAYRYGIGDTVRWTDTNDKAFEGVVKASGYQSGEDGYPGRWIQDEYGRPGALVQVPGETSWRFVLASTMTVVGGECVIPEDIREPVKPPAPCPGYGELHESKHWDCFYCYPD